MEACIKLQEKIKHEKLQDWSAISVADSETIIKLLIEKFPSQVEAIELNPKQTAVQIDPKIVVAFFEFIYDATRISRWPICHRFPASTRHEY